MPFEPDHVLLGKFVDAHERGDLAGAAEYWERLAVNNFDRVRNTVKGFRFSPGGPGVPQDEHGSAASEAFLRVIAMSAGFRKRETGRFYAALATCVENACRDFGRKELRHQKRSEGSLDQTYEPDGEAGPYDAALAAYDAAGRISSVSLFDEGGMPAPPMLNGREIRFSYDERGRCVKPFLRASPWICRISAITASSVPAIAWWTFAGSCPSTK